MRTLKFFFPILFLCVAHQAWAQREDAGNYDYDKEYLLGVNKNTNGGLIGGFAIKIGTRIDDSQFSFLSLELSNVKHPKET